MSKGDGEVVCFMVGEVLWAIVDMEVKSTGRGCTQKLPSPWAPDVELI